MSMSHMILMSLCCSCRIRWLVGYDPAELLGKKGYDYFHPMDLVATSHCHAKCEYVYHPI